LKVDEASLTGESMAVTRRPGQMVLAGAVVQQGELAAVVSCIGANTFFGEGEERKRGPCVDSGCLPGVEWVWSGC
jgi:hypothetical protein